MNNLDLTPLQQVAATLMAGMLVDFRNQPLSLKQIREQAIDQAKLLLEATKPEPLEWVKATEGLHQSRVEYFTISEYDTDINGDKLTNIEYQLRDNGKFIGYFFDLDIAKSFAEFIRSR